MTRLISRSVSHDSYFDMLQNSQNNSEGSLLDLSEIQLNFDLEESEMRIFSEDESLVSSPRIQKDVSSAFSHQNQAIFINYTKYWPQNLREPCGTPNNFFFTGIP